MSEFLRLLAVYYLCDSAAALRPLSTAEIAACVEVYGRVKAHFSDLDAQMSPSETAARHAAAYAAFKAWEAANSGQVAAMRREAQRQASR